MATIKLFKQLATITHDNNESAAREWGRTWGNSWWRSLWRYKEYTLGNLTYRTGRVYMRHYDYQETEYEINGEGVGKTAFMREFERQLNEGIIIEPAPAYVATIAPVQSATAQLSLF